MPVRYEAASKPELRPIGDAEIEQSAMRQADCVPEFTDLLDARPSWAPLSVAQIRERLAEEAKKPHTAVFAIYRGGEFVGIGEWSANWDSWAPYAGFIIWPEHRRKGIGAQVARMLLDKCFLENPGHEVVAGAPEWNEPAVRFLRSLGFKEAGRMRATHYRGGRPCDTLFFDILRSEYLGKGRGARR